eukprot:CAMPEP_0174859378 /NCGR_PEP_ID=MMETSP1114-20130205/46236_1 /TAXON_ID=312471 /ORGANISM="Neobodo designis, Strain CCAP 1951/1" /LENGTH=250 /DNA_ID=CAMNT_0016094327 /DNA_START=79 /DNA_END=828 /DNA_ORIENTATION=+
MVESVQTWVFLAGLPNLVDLRVDLSRATAAAMAFAVGQEGGEHSPTPQQTDAIVESVHRVEADAGPRAVFQRLETFHAPTCFLDDPPTEELCAKMLRCMPVLREIELGKVVELSGACLAALQRPELLHTFSVEGLRRVSTAVLVRRLSKLRNLRALTLKFDKPFRVDEYGNTEDDTDDDDQDRSDFDRDEGSVFVVVAVLDSLRTCCPLLRTVRVDTSSPAVLVRWAARGTEWKLQYNRKTYMGPRRENS